MSRSRRAQRADGIRLHLDRSLPARHAGDAALVTKFGSKRLLRLGALVGATSGILLLVTTLTGWGGLWGLVVPLFLLVSCAGLIVANSIGMALRDFPRQAGAVSLSSAQSITAAASLGRS